MVVDPAERLLAAIAGRVELALPGLELLAGADQLRLLGGDRVAGRADPLDSGGGVVAKLADAADDLGVLILDPLQILVAAQGIVVPSDSSTTETAVGSSAL